MMTARAVFTRQLMRLQLCVLLLALLCVPTLAQKKESAAKKQKLPSPEKIVNDYLKAIGGKKRVAAVRDATYEWKLEELRSQTSRLGTARTQLKAPASTRMEVSFADDLVKVESIGASPASAPQSKHLSTGANARSAWVLDSAGSLRTLTDQQAHTAKLQSLLDANHLLDYKKSNILARTVSIEEVAGEPAYVVEFSLRNGARLRYLFSVSNKLLLATRDEAQHVSRLFTAYREENGLLEPHQLQWPVENNGTLTLTLQSVAYNTGLADTLFDPPSAEVIDINALLTDVDRNQEQLDERVSDYTYTEKLTERKINDKGEVTEETVKVFEVYPIPGSEDVRKLISENGVPLSAEKTEKEQKRVTEELEKAQRAKEKEAAKRERARQQGKPVKDEDDDPGIADFLRAAELVSPRRERLRDRDAIVFDFRPRAGYKPKSSIESIVTKLTGVVWIDPVDKQVIRLEARLVESYKMGGGLVASVRPGTAFIFEQKRMEDGVWLPVFTQANISAKIFLFKGLNINVTEEFSNYQRFNSNFDDYKLTSPDKKEQPPSKP